MTAEASPPAPPPSDRLLIVLLAVTTAAGPVTMNIYLPALPHVQAHFGTTVAGMNTTVSLALTAFALGILVHGPLSDRYGRRPVILAGLLIFAVGNLLCLFAPSFEVLLAGRIVQALGTAAGVVVARAMLGDLYGREKMARMLAYLTMVMVVGPTVAPLVGGFVTEAFGWQSIFALLLAANALIFGFAWRHMPETRRADPQGSGAAALARESLAMLRRPVFLGLALQAAMIYAIFLAFISIAPYVMSALGHRASAYGTWYLLVALGYFLGNWIVTRHASRIGLTRLISLGLVIQLACAVAGVVLVVAGLWHPAAIFIPMSLLAFGQGLALPNITASAVALAPRTPGSAASMLGFTQQLVGALAVQGMAAFPAGSPVPIYVFTVVVALAAWLSLFAMPREEALRQG
ncbi:MAG: permease (Drug) [Proteobacteria bacterium]|nr:permease (Drug) [Pseudomonadota bacterium]